MSETKEKEVVHNTFGAILKDLTLDMLAGNKGVVINNDVWRMVYSQPHPINIEITADVPDVVKRIVERCNR